MTKWNYSLYGVQDTNAVKTLGDFPGGAAAFNAATTKNDLKGQTKMKWFKEDPGIEWYLIDGGEATKKLGDKPKHALKDHHR